MPAPTKSHRAAVVLERPGEPVVMEVPMPPVPPVYALVKTTAVALHAVDIASTYYYGANGTIGGCEFAGTVVEVGSEVEQDLKPGDRVAGFVHGNKTDSMDVMARLFKGQETGSPVAQENPLAQEIGAFSEYVLAHGDICFKIPPDMSDEDAATYGASMTVAGMALYMAMKLPRPHEPSPRKLPILINGAACASGVMAVQLAKLSGMSVIVTSSPIHHEWLKSLGADHVYDYHDPDAARKIRRDHPHISLGYDCSNSPNAWKLLEASFSLSGGHAVINTMPPTTVDRPEIRWEQVYSYTAFGERFTLGPIECPEMPQNYEWTKQWWREASVLIWAGKLKPLRAIVRDGGLEGVVEGVTGDLKNDKVSGHKLVYRI